MYRQGARVTRVVPVLAAGELRVGPLPLCLEDGSVRVRVEGEGVRALDVRVALAVAPADASLPPADDEALRAARRHAETLRSELERLNRAHDRLQALEMLPRPKPKAGEAPLGVPLDSRLALLALRGAESERIERERSRIREELSQADHALAEAEDRHRRTSTQRSAREHALCKEAVVRLEGAPSSGSTLSLEYVVPGARWSPAYALTLDAEGRAPARLEMRALVAQRTGEDWSGARLVLSTADPDRFVELPELPRLRIGRAQPPPARRGFRAPPEGAEALYADYDAAFGSRTEEAPETTPATAAAVGSRGGFGGAPGESFQTNDAEAGLELAAVAGIMDEQSLPPPAPPPPPLAAAPARAMRVRAGTLEKSSGPSLGGVVPQGAADIPAYPRAEPAILRPAAPDLDLEALAFARLRMASADGEGRGELRAVTWSSAYVEDLGGVVTVDVVSAVRVAFGRAQEIGAPPPGHETASAPDGFYDAYAADLPCDVPSDGAFHAVPVTAYEAPGAIRYVTVPREGPEVYRVLELQSPLSGSLLPGPVDIYERRDEQVTFLLTARVDAAPPRAEVRLGLGVEQSVKVARNTTFTEQTKGLLGGGLSLVHDVEVDVQNRLARPVTVEVRERVPVRANEEDDAVEVEMGTVAPAWERWDQEKTLRGGRRWVVEVGARASRKLSARYTVRIASKHELRGGNRRES